jgi:hypothetical protein
MSDYERAMEFQDGEWVEFWRCCNCCHRRPIGKSTVRVNKQRLLIERVRKAVEDCDTHGSGPVRFDWAERTTDRGDIYVLVSGRYGPDTSMLSVVSFRLIGICFTAGGGMHVYSDSKHKEDELESVTSQLRRGKLHHW